VDRTGQQVRLSYDRLNRVTGMAYADGNAETRDYDAVGRLVRITDAAGTVAFEYDEMDRLAKEITEHAGQINSVEYRYDALDRLVERTVNGADPTSYGYDLASRVLFIGFRGTTVGYEWDEASRLTAKTLPNGTRQEYGYDDADRLLEIRFVRSDGGLIDSIAYQYDANGRRIAKTTGLPSNNETLITGTYDQANRMTSVTFAGIPPGTGETCTLGYDANGNLTAKVCPGGATIYSWDAQDRLVAIAGPDLAASFRYDVLGRRIERTVNGVTTGYLYDGVQAIAEFGAEEAGLLTGLAIDEALGRFAGSGELTMLTDALGSVVAEARADESVATRYGYSPYGETVGVGEGCNPSSAHLSH
jgi:YD repeat-containing protein